MTKEEQIQELRNKISYWIEKSKTLNSQVEKGLLADKILAARKEIGALESKSLDRIKRVDIIDAPPVADRIEANSRMSRSNTVINYLPGNKDKSNRVVIDINNF